MQLKKTVIRLFTFLSCVLGCYLLCFYLLSIFKTNAEPLIYGVSEVVMPKGGNTFKKFEDFDEEKKYDVIVIGSSHAYRGYDPRIFKKNGWELFNLGTSGQTPLNSYYLIQRYIKKAHYKLVILDVYDEAFTSDGLESTADLMQNIPSTATVLKMGLSLKDPRILNMLAMRFLGREKPGKQMDNTYVMNGYNETVDSVKKPNKKMYTSNGQLNPVQLNYFEKIMVYLNDQQVNAVIVTHPAPIEWNITEHKKMQTMIRTIASRYQVEYLDYFDYPGFDSRTDFYDAHHLNQTGVQKFNTILLQDLKLKNYLQE
jgi:hypothetical protein